MFSTGIDDLHEKMSCCFQTAGQSMLQHGQSVAKEALNIIHNMDNHALKGYEYISDKLNLEHVSISDLILYWTYHDCGKHLCLEIDEFGRKHYPNHAEISATQFEIIWPHKPHIAELIRRDMDFHTKRGDEITELWKHPYADILYLTAWAELESNSKMFGGKDSDSYKIKRKQLIKAFNRKEKK